MRIGILTSGGDCPGINATIRSVCKTAINHYGMEVMGIHSGFQGLLDNDMEQFSADNLSGLLGMGGTVLGTSRVKLFPKHGHDGRTENASRLLKTVELRGIDCLICIGGNGTQNTAARLAAMGVNVVTIPQTIDNDVWGTDITLGFDSAVEIATEAIDRLHSTASSHKRVMVIEVMGHEAGWLALHSGMAGGGDIILLPEIPYRMHNLGNVIIDRLKRGKPYSIVVVAEGTSADNERRKHAGEYIAEEIEYETGFETRETVLGYLQRGGAPTSFDRNLSTLMGSYAIGLVAERKFGQMVAFRNNVVTSVPLEEVCGRSKLVTAEHRLIVEGLKMGVCFG